jgi:hypothetical protein
MVPRGAPAAKAANIAVPIQAITLPALCAPTRTSPQVVAPVMMKLSAPPNVAGYGHVLLFHLEPALRILVMMQPVSDPGRAPDFLPLVCDQLHYDVPATATSSSSTSNPHSVTS